MKNACALLVLYKSGNNKQNHGLAKCRRQSYRRKCGIYLRVIKKKKKKKKKTG
jgi:hypothetical protein